MKRFGRNGRWNFAAVAVLCLFLAGCFGAAADDALEEADNKITELVGKQQKIYTDNQPPPIYQYSAPRDIATQIYNLTTPNMPDTWSVLYQFNMPPEVCKSRGYPLPYGVQLTNSEYLVAKGNGHDPNTTHNLPQAEPNGLYMDGLSTSASWVLCDYGQGYELVYAEGEVRTYAHPVKVAANGTIEHLAGPPSVTLDLSRTGSATGLNPNDPSQD